MQPFRLSRRSSYHIPFDECNEIFSFPTAKGNYFIARRRKQGRTFHAPVILTLVFGVTRTVFSAAT